MGDDCRRSDAEWGYRPVGNALLKLGAEGEQILDGFLHQTTDRRLADQAWRSLYVRQDNGTFSEVTEQENDAAFAHRPEWLDRHSSNGFSLPRLLSSHLSIPYSLPQPTPGPKYPTPLAWEPDFDDGGHRVALNEGFYSVNLSRASAVKLIRLTAAGGRGPNKDTANNDLTIESHIRTKREK